MSQHNKTDFKHFTKEQMDTGLEPTKPSQLSNGFRSGAEWAASALLAKLSAGVRVEAVAHVKFWAAQQVSHDGGVEADEGLEVCRPGDVGVDGIAAEPVFSLSQPQTAIAAARVQENERCAAKVDELGDEHTWRISAAIRALIGANHG